MTYNPIDIDEFSQWLAVSEWSPSGLIWARQRHHRAPPAGTAAGSLSKGRWNVYFKGRSYPAARVVRALTDGLDHPELEVDHIDRDPTNNLPSNLRWADRTTQNLNRKPMGPSGVKYVSFSRGRWRVEHWKHGFVGYYDNLEEATKNAQKHFGNCS